MVIHVFRALAFIAFSSLAIGGSSSCIGTTVVPREVWDLAKDADLLARFTHVPLPMPSLLVAAFFDLQSGHALEEAIDDCSVGVAVLILHALPEVERRLGSKAARRFYTLYERLRANADGHHISHTVSLDLGHQVRTFTGPRWGLTTFLSPSFPFLLGASGAMPADRETILRIFVYDSELAVWPLSCGWGGTSTEVFVHRYLLNSGARTQDPSAADLFFVPVYSHCAITLGSRLTEKMDAFYIALVSRLEYFQRFGGRDHIFLWSSETYDFPSWEDFIQPSIFLAVESRPIKCSDPDLWYWVQARDAPNAVEQYCWHCSSCFDPSKDVLIPPMVEKWSVDRLLGSDRDFDERNLLACYHGSDSDTSGRMYHFANATVRNRLQMLRGSPNTSIGQPFPVLFDYFDMLGRCIFCFVPKGLGFFSFRLFEVMFAGCIPVILSDDIGLPFNDLINWAHLSLKWPMRDVGPALLNHLQQRIYQNLTLVQDQHEAIRTARCWFDYHRTDDPHCSPYAGILRTLRQLHFPGQI